MLYIFAIAKKKTNRQNVYQSGQFYNSLPRTRTANSIFMFRFAHADRTHHVRQHLLPHQQRVESPHHRKTLRDHTSHSISIWHPYGEGKRSVCRFRLCLWMPDWMCMRMWSRNSITNEVISLALAAHDLTVSSRPALSPAFTWKHARVFNVYFEVIAVQNALRCAVSVPDPVTTRAQHVSAALSRYHDIRFAKHPPTSQLHFSFEQIDSKTEPHFTCHQPHRQNIVIF